MNVAVTALLAVIVNEHGEVEQLEAEPVPPLKPAKVEPALAVAMISTVVPFGCGLVQAPAEPPLNLHWTVPAPVPAVLTVSVRGISVNVAVTELFAVIVNEQGEVEQLEAEPVPPLKPAKVEPALAVAMISTVVPFGCGLVQAPAEPPLNLHWIVPVPVPALVTVSVRGISVNVAVTELLAFSVKLHGDVEQADAEPVPPLKPANSEPALAVAMISTVVPLGLEPLQASAEPPLNLHW
ncbi:MAG TPA: hypothetical protein VFW48_01375, partial [Solirubrobacterales bacterium]|nr:hypothetical protein [Solirubrobacterales bacterium]